MILPLTRWHCPAVTLSAQDAGPCTLSVKSVTKASIVFCAWQRTAELLHSIPLFARCLVTKTLVRATTSFWFAITLLVTKTSSIARTHPAIAVSRAQQRHHVPHCLPLSRQCHVGQIRNTNSALVATSTATIDLYCVPSQRCGSRSAAMTARRQTGSKATLRSAANVRVLLRRMAAASKSIPSFRGIPKC